MKDGQMITVEGAVALMRARVAGTRLCQPCLAAAAVPVDGLPPALQELQKYVIVLQQVGRCAACGQEADIYSLTLPALP